MAVLISGTDKNHFMDFAVSVLAFFFPYLDKHVYKAINFIKPYIGIKYFKLVVFYNIINKTLVCTINTNDKNVNLD